jgi:hypothetical protein
MARYIVVDLHMYGLYSLLCRQDTYHHVDPGRMMVTVMEFKPQLRGEEEKEREERRALWEKREKREERDQGEEEEKREDK